MPIPKSEFVVARSRKKQLTVKWYGCGTRQLEIVTGTGNWFKSGFGLLPVLSIFVRDLTGMHWDEYFFTTDLSMTAKRVIELDAAR